MRTRVDRFGRVVLPKVIRDRLGLAAGTAVEIEEGDDHIALRPVGDGPPLVVNGGVLVFMGTAIGDLESAVAATRDERTRRLGTRRSR